MRFLIGLFFVVELNNIRNEAFVGQDFGTHTTIMDQLMNDREGKWFFMDGTNRPAVYWVGGLCKRFTRELYTIQLASIFFVLLGMAALHFFHRSLLVAVRTPEIRVAVVALAALLPAHLIAGVVFAGDVGVMLPFALACWALVRSLSATDSRRALFYAALAGTAIAAGDFVKVSFALQPVAVLIGVALVWRWGRIDARRAGLTALLAALFPLMVGGALQWRNHRETAKAERRHTFDWRGTGEMTWKSLLGLKADDRHVLDAPTYWEKTPDNQLNLIQPNRYSYPALLHLGIFTDVLNYADMGGYRCTTQPRHEPQQRYAVLSVRAGLLWSVVALLGALSLALLVGAAVFRPSLAPATGVVVWALQGAAWYFPIMLVLPFIMSSYSWGYWLPRLIVPALWSAALVGGWFLDQIFHGRSVWWVRVLLALALAQTWLHFRSIWF